MKKDNSTLRRKVSLRLSALALLKSPPGVVETHGGAGVLYARCYAHLERGVVFEKDAVKAESLARQRPGWSVYESDCLASLQAGAGFHHAPNFFDLDPYGQPWPVLDAILSHHGKWADGPAVFAVNDGLRQKLSLTGGWDVESMQEAVRTFGASKMYARYLEVVRWLLDRKAAAVGRRVGHFVGYHTGTGKGMTHYAFSLLPA